MKSPNNDTLLCLLPKKKVDTKLEKVKDKS